MKLKSKIIPYSSVVGGGLALLDENGRAAFQVLFIGTTNGITKRQDQELARQFDEYITKHGLEVSGWMDLTPPRNMETR